ncbi:MAG: replication endonuclease, partial [Gammaproteobacteria bacterium]
MGCRPFRNKIFDKHLAARELLVKSYMRIARESNYVKANLNLLALNERLSRGELKLSMTDCELREFCKTKAWLCQRIHARRDDDSAEKRIRAILARTGIDFPDCDQLPALERCKDQQWWRRQVRRLQARELEQISREMKLVHKKDEIYASNTNVQSRRSQKARNRLLLSELKATNQFGDEFSLQELSDASVSNPEIRRAELMVRLRGFEEFAKAQQLKADFYTITCPSRFHAAHQNGRAVSNYGNYSARDANEYLQKVWARIRAKLAREDIGIFGFRVSEPHHDGCPHWHLVL